MKKEFKNYIVNSGLLNNCSKLLIAVSGGPDSLAMLDLFSKFKENFKIEIAAAHLDHMFREESKSEADFVGEFAEKKGINYFRKKVNLPEYIKRNNLSPEAAARKKRFEFFKKTMIKGNFDLLALAHHRDDQVETVLLNLFRGSGLKGLSGIQSKTEINDIKIIHPLLEFSKKEILDYCQKNNLKPRFDHSNKKNIYSRNIVRNKILPVIEQEINPNVREVIIRSSKLINEENEFLQKLAKKYFKEIVKTDNKAKIIIDFNQFKNIEQVLQRRIYRLIYIKLNNNLNDFYLEHIFEIEKLISDNQTGRGIDIASGIRVELSYNNLVFLKKDSSENRIDSEITVKINGKTEINEKKFLETELIDNKNFSFSNNDQQAAFDYEKIKLPLIIRNRNPGDKLKPLGMTGHKKVKDILIDEKIAKYERDNIPVIADDDDSIIWLAPYKISEKHKVTNKTNKILILKLKNNLKTI